MIRIVLVDDHPVVRAGLAALLSTSEDLVVAGEASDLASAVAVVEAERPDVVLMDLNLGGADDGIAVTRRLLDLPSPPKVLVLTTYDTEADILAALDAGASGYLLKDAPGDELLNGIRAAAQGTTALAPSVAATLVRRASDRAPSVTEREVEVLQLLARGLGNKEIAASLYVSEATVKSHLAHIYTKLGTDTRAGAVAAAIERRIIRPQ